MHYLLVILDGAADRPSKALDWKTPLEAAGMENLNKIARHSKAGMLYPIKKGIAPESDSAVFSILSYDIKDYTGRGSMEALGAGLNVKKGTLAFRANFATIDEKKRIINRRCALTKDEARRLEKEINKIKIDGARFKFKATVGYRGAVVFDSNSKLSPEITNIDVGYIRKGNISIAVAAKKRNAALPKARPIKDTKEAVFTARIVNQFVEKVIEKLSNSEVNEERRRRGLSEANALLLRDAGLGLPKVEKISKKFGMKFCFVTEMPVERGIAKLLGMKELMFETEKEGVERYKELARVVNENIDKCGFMYVHIKGPDEPGHAGDAEKKRDVLKAIDSGFFSKLRLRNELRVCVTCDHSTPCELKAHSSDPVPVIISSDKHDGLEFNEKIDSKGSLGIFNGKELIGKIISG